MFFIFKIALFCAYLLNMCESNCTADTTKETMEDPIIDSKMTMEEIFDGLSPDCPIEIKSRQQVVDVLYYSFDGMIHQGQIVIDEALADDVNYAFQKALVDKFSIQSVIPISHRDYRKNGRWNDELSMQKNNSSGFNYREMAGQSKLSNHAFGWALDINPVQNPYIKGDRILPPQAKYVQGNQGTLTHDSAFTKALIERGWEWGGDWKTLKDYQHFEKRLERIEK